MRVGLGVIFWIYQPFGRWFLSKGCGTSSRSASRFLGRYLYQPVLSTPKTEEGGSDDDGDKAKGTSGSVS